jgi:hypothetical protein
MIPRARLRIDLASPVTRSFCPPFGTVRPPYGFARETEDRRGRAKRAKTLTDRDRTEPHSADPAEYSVTFGRE